MATTLNKTFCPAATLGGWTVSKPTFWHFCSRHQFADNVGLLIVHLPDVAASLAEL